MTQIGESHAARQQVVHRKRCLSASTREYSVVVTAQRSKRSTETACSEFACYGAAAESTHLMDASSNATKRRRMDGVTSRVHRTCRSALSRRRVVAAYSESPRSVPAQAWPVRSAARREKPHELSVRLLIPRYPGKPRFIVSICSQNVGGRHRRRQRANLYLFGVRRRQTELWRESICQHHGLLKRQ